MTRGQRNNNPLNIRRSHGTRWLGQSTVQHDREFVQFRAPLFGLRAAFRLMRTYLEVYRLDTLRQVVGRWAPPEDGNNTESYLAAVCRLTGLLPSQPLDFADEKTLTAVLRAMAWVESRTTLDDPDLLHQAYLLAR